MADKRTNVVAGRRTVSLGRVSTADAIVNELVSEILDGTLEAGAQLPEVELSQRFGVSRQSFRTALAELAFRGIVEREPHRSVRVAVMTRRDAADIYMMRELLEGAAIRWLVEHASAWPEIEAAVEVLRRLPRSAPWSDIVEGDVHFHRASINAVGSPRLSRLHAYLSEEMRLILVPARHYLTQDSVVREHEELYRAIREGDAEAAIERFRQHLAFGTADLLAHLPE